MTTTNQRHPAQQCPPPCDNPAGQPKDPGGTCEKQPPNPPPKVPEPVKCEPKCECPHDPPTTHNCLEDLIALQKKEIDEAERAKVFKADLDAMLAKAKAAVAEYTQVKYEKLVEDWKRNDTDIENLIRKLVCAVPCWRCLIECYVCPLLEEIRYRETMLYGDGTLYADVKNLYDLRYWTDRDRTIKKARLDRIKGVLAAWNTPAQTIEKAIADIAKLIADSGKTLAPDAAKVVYDVFLKLIPLHLAIAPPASSGVVTRIDREFTEFCECDVGQPDDCCGPDVGVPTLRSRLIGPQPYLVEPSDYFPIICCLAKERFLPANEAWSEAESAFTAADNLITTYRDEVTERLKTLEKTAKSALPADCKWWEDPDNCEPSPAQAR